MGKELGGAPGLGWLAGLVTGGVDSLEVLVVIWALSFGLGASDSIREVGILYVIPVESSRSRGHDCNGDMGVWLLCFWA